MPASARALERARAAVELDVARDFPAAARAYRDAAAALDADADADADGADGLRRKAREYRERADELEATTRETTVDYTSLVGVASGAARAKTTMETTSSHPGSAAGTSPPPGGRKGRTSDSCQLGLAPLASRVRLVTP